MKATTLQDVTSPNTTTYAMKNANVACNVTARIQEHSTKCTSTVLFPSYFYLLDVMIKKFLSFFFLWFHSPAYDYEY
jgi:hypothetical protein